MKFQQTRSLLIVAALAASSLCPADAERWTPSKLPQATAEARRIVRSASESAASGSKAGLLPRGGQSTEPTKLEALTGGPPPIPEISDYRKFALPCLGLWVAQPLLSLVDTAFVGLSGDASKSAQQLAALGPATTFFDGATYLFAFLNVASTNLYASARAQKGEQSDRAESVVRVASRMALNCGFGIMLFLYAFARPLLGLYIGGEASATPGLLDSAVEYVKIRALSLPTSLLLGAVQACLLGAKDSVTPLVAILYSTTVNLIGDFILVNRMKMGLRGAAIATLMAQWAATLALIGPARRRLVRDHSLGLFQKISNTDDSVSGKSFLSFALPVLTLIIGKLAAFGFMTHSAAAVPGQPIPLASHQIILSLFFFVSPFMEVISQTAQSFLPPYIAPVLDYIDEKLKMDPTFDPTSDSDIATWKAASMKACNNLLMLGFMSAVLIASTTSLIPAFYGNLLTNDVSVQTAAKPLAKYLWAGAFLTAPVAVSEGILLAQRELGYLAVIYLLSTAVLPYALWQIKAGGTVKQVWACFAIFQLFRAATFAGRVWLAPLLRRSPPEIKKEETTIDEQTRGVVTVP